MADDFQLITSVPALPRRAAAMHKGDAGSVFCLAGSMGMVGAATLCSRAALRAGAGVVRVGMPWRLAVIVAGRDPNVMTAALPETEDGSISPLAEPKILKAAEGYDVMLLGPGISSNPHTIRAVTSLVPLLKMKLLIDADGLNILAQDDCRCLKDYDRNAGLPVLTPHPGEMLRLTHGTDDLRAGDDVRRKAATAFARKHKVVVALKGHRTVVTDGKRVYINTTGNPGMAKAGMGDVLSGVIAALMAQNFDSFNAAVLGVYLHGLAGDMVRDRMGEIGMLATDVIEELPQAARSMQEPA
jgi:NAD(P)H-hydrate epimerase